MCVALSIDFGGFLEAGVGARQHEQEKLTRLIDRWAKSRGVRAKSWMVGASSTDRSRAGAAAGMVLVAFGHWAKRVQSVMAWPDGRGLFAEAFVAQGQTAWLGLVYAPSGRSAARRRTARRRR